MAHQFAHWILEKGTSQRDLAKKVGVSQSVISYFAQGRMTPTKQEKEKLAQAGVPVLLIWPERAA